MKRARQGGEIFCYEEAVTVLAKRASRGLKMREKKRGRREGGKQVSERSE